MKRSSSSYESAVSPERVFAGMYYKDDNGRSIIKVCGCGEEYDARGWAGLEYHGLQDDGDGFPALEYRHCTCGSTITIPVEVQPVAQPPVDFLRRLSLLRAKEEAKIIAKLARVEAELKDKTEAMMLYATESRRAIVALIDCGDVIHKTHNPNGRWRDCHHVHCVDHRHLLAEVIGADVSL